MVKIHRSTRQAIEVSNKSDFDLYGSTYYFKKEAEKAGDTKLIASGTKEEFVRPPLQGLKKRKLVFSLNEDDLKQKMSSSEYHLLPHMSIGVGSKFYIDLDQGSLKGYNYAQWKIIEYVKGKLSGVTGKLDDATLGTVRSKYLSGKAYSLREASASVRIGTDIPPQEEFYLSRRRPKVKAALEHLLERQLAYKDVPKIMIAGSGGGYRAMLGFLGFLEDAYESGLLDTVTYISALSGSTWTLGPWISSGWSLDEFKERLLEKIKTDIYVIKPNIVHFVNNLILRMAFKQPITAVNMYGQILGYNLLADLPGGPFGVYLHNQRFMIQDGSKPFPIYTAVATKLPYQWVEFTPYEMGGDYFGGYIPIGAFGAPFLDGEMRYFTPPYSLAFILAICGSAFAARLKRVASEVEGSIPFWPVRKALKIGLEEFTIGKYRVSAARVYNWTWGMRPLPRAQQEIIKLIDGGIAYNFGLEALYRREPDIIIIADFSASTVIGSELVKAEHDLRARGFKVPPIDYTAIDKKSFSIFKDENDPTVPIIIYFPHIKNPQHSFFDPQECLANCCGTFNFLYKKDQAHQLIELSRQTVKGVAPQIIEEINEWIDARKVIDESLVEDTGQPEEIEMMAAS